MKDFSAFLINPELSDWGSIEVVEEGDLDNSSSMDIEGINFKEVVCIVE